MDPSTQVDMRALKKELKLFWHNLDVKGEFDEDPVSAVNILRLVFIAKHASCPTDE